MLIAGCSTISPAPPPRSAVADDAFRLELVATSSRYASGQPVGVTARLTYIGPEAKVFAWGSGSGPVLFALNQVDGPFDPGGGGDDMCARYEFLRGAPQEIEYRKSGGWDGGDPMADAYTAFFADPLVRLPDGVFEFNAAIELSVGDCGPADAFHKLDTAVRVGVGSAGPD